MTASERAAIQRFLAAYNTPLYLRIRYGWHYDFLKEIHR